MKKIYKIINETTGEVIYIGSTQRTLKQRFMEHYKKDDEKGEYMRTNKCAIIRIETVEKVNQKKCETLLIDMYSPIFNKKFEVKNYKMKDRQISKMIDAECNIKVLMKQPEKVSENEKIDEILENIFNNS